VLNFSVKRMVLDVPSGKEAGMVLLVHIVSGPAVGGVPEVT
jgi:hypothetical protein